MDSLDGTANSSPLSREQVSGAQVSRKRVTVGCKYAIADIVSVSFVDVSEVIDAQQDYGTADRPAVTLSFFAARGSYNRPSRFHERLGKLPAVWGTGQRVDVRIHTSTTTEHQMRGGSSAICFRKRVSALFRGERG